MGLRIQIGLLFLCQLFLPKEIEAQISAIGQSFTDTATYPVSNFKDLVFVYNVSCFGGNNPSATLLAIAPNNLDSCNYVWTGYNIQDHSFDLAVKTESQVSSSQLSGIGEGGYQVRISRTGKLDTTFRCWIFIHHLSVSVLKTADGKVLTSKYTCQYVELNGSLTTDTLLYYDPVSGDTVKLMNNTSYWWSYSNKEGVKDKAFLNSLNPRTYSPPVYNTHYYLVSTDKFNASCSDTVLYISIQTRSVFEYKYFDHYGDSTGYIPMDPQGVSAPAKFEFINHSINGATYQWILTDTVFAGDTVHRIIDASDTLLKPVYTYYIPRQYLAKLVSKSAEHCVDTSVTEILIYIKPSELGAVPNVFTPNNDGKNDYFVFYPYDDDVKDNPGSRFASIRTFHITIFDRWGRKVHEFNGDINDWVGNGKDGSHGGWDGKILGTNADAVPGIYYYIIVATGWDNIVYQGTTKQYMGFVYLYR
jgi:CHU_C Type IX secretion signal domain